MSSLYKKSMHGKKFPTISNSWRSVWATPGKIKGPGLCVKDFRLSLKFLLFFFSPQNIKFFSDFMSLRSLKIWPLCVKIPPTQFSQYWHNPAQILAKTRDFSVISNISFQTECAEAQPRMSGKKNVAVKIHTVWTVCESKHEQLANASSNLLITFLQNMFVLAVWQWQLWTRKKSLRICCGKTFWNKWYVGPDYPYLAACLVINVINLLYTAHIAYTLGPHIEMKQSPAKLSGGVNF